MSCQLFCPLFNYETYRALTKFQSLAYRWLLSSLGAFHSELNHFALKMIGLSYEGLLLRTRVCILRHIESCQWSAMLNSDGTLRTRVQRKKVSHQQPINRVVQEVPTFQYRDLLFQRLEAAVLSGPVSMEILRRPDRK